MRNYTLPSSTHIGDIRLKINDLQKSIDFYTKILGFQILDKNGISVKLTTAGNSEPLIILNKLNNSISKPRNTTGLYHFAIKLPTDSSLADLFSNILEHDWPIQGAADHIVSKAIYFADPDGNGIEIYSDRPRELWEWNDGEIMMSTAHLDLNILLHQATGSSKARRAIHPKTTIGHVHLTVSDLADSQKFYHEIIGMDVTQRSYPGALFFSGGGYHHHVGVNTWSGVGVPPPPSNSVGLESFSMIIPDLDIWKNIQQRLNDSEFTAVEEQTDKQWEKILTQDPSANRIEIRTHKNMK